MTLSRLSVLSTEEIERIHGASMRILETVGVKVDHGKAREILGASGAKVEGSRVCIPEELVRKALEQAPAEFSLYGFASFFQKLGTGAAL